MSTPITHQDPVLLEMRSITKEFPGVKALSDVSLRVKVGEIHAICGENGAGKSTLMKVLSGVYPYGSYDGDIVYQAEVQQFKDIRASEHAGIVIIHQELALIPELSIMENIFLGNEPVRRGIIDWAEARKRSIELLARVGLREDPDTPIKEIGVGKQQLVEIAKALNKSVKLLILDEPTAALNESDSQHLLDLILGLKGRASRPSSFPTSSTRSSRSRTRSPSSAMASPSRRSTSWKTASTRTGSSRAWSGGRSSPASRTTRRRSARCSSKSRIGRSGIPRSRTAWSARTPASMCAGVKSSALPA
ncbi:L-arabinose transport ATP-binding protein AraG [Arthrobacter sp. Hiyo8]|nr:L-arabinose transport ATP-binding protein AraG [Arthrobacter sp. Hiyo8]